MDYERVMGNPRERKVDEVGKGMSFIQFMYMTQALLIAEGLGSEALSKEIDWEKNFVMKNPTLADSKEVDLPVITWNMKERLPGKVTSEHRELKPRRRTMEIRNEKGEIIGYDIFDGRIVEILVEFTIFGHTNQEVLITTREFTELMDTYKGDFMKRGLLNYWFVSETEGMQDQTKDEMVSRIVTYNVRIQEVTELDPSYIKKILLNVDTLRDSLEEKKSLGV